MALIDNYRSNLQRKRQELSKFQIDKAKEQKKHSDILVKKNKAKEIINRSVCLQPKLNF